MAAPDFEFDTQSAAPGTPNAPQGAPSFEFGDADVQAAGPGFVQTVTPKRIGRFLSQVPQRLEQTQKQAEDERLSRAAGAQMEIGTASDRFQKAFGVPPDIYQKALAATGSASDTMTGGLFPYIPALAAKGLGKIGVTGYERYADMPLVEAKKEAERKVQTASTLQPGAALTGQAAGFVGGAKMLPPVAQSAGPVRSGVATGAVYGGMSGLAQEGDPMDALKGVALGAVLGGTAAPIIEKTASGLTRLVKGGKPVVNEAGQLTEEAVATARAAGLSNEEIQRLAPYLQQTFERRGVTPAAAREARFTEFGMIPTRGMVTDDAAQLAREKKFGDFGPLAAQAGEAAQATAGGTGAPLRDAVADAVARGSREAAKLKGQYEAAYKAAETIPGKFDRAAISGVGERIRNNWATDPSKLDFYASDLATKAAKDLDSVLGTPIQVAPGVSVTHQTFRAVESGRKILNAAMGQAKTQTDRAAVRRMVDDFDNHIEKSITNGAFSGDPKVVDQWRAARKLFSEYQNKFGVRRTGEEAGTLMKQILDGSKSADDVGNMMFNFSSSGDATMKQSAIKVFLQLRRALGPSSPELEQVKKSYIQQLMTPTAAKEGKIAPQDFLRTAQQIDQTLKGRGANFARMALTPEERQSLSSYARVMRAASASAASDMPEKVNMIARYAATAVPLIASGANYALALINPVLAGVAGVVGAIPGAVSTLRNLPSSQARLANAPPKSVARPYTFPSVRTGVPLATEAAPDIAETVPPVLEGLQRAQQVAPEEKRPQRASGGAVNLKALASAARKAVTKSTEDLLRAPDEHVVKALEVANRHI